MKSLLIYHAHKTSDQINNQPMLERRLFENIWMIYSSTLLTFFLSTTKEIEIPLNISDKIQINNYFNRKLPIWEHDFVKFWSNHSIRKRCSDHCSKALVIDGFQKPDRYVCEFTDIIHSDELGKFWSFDKMQLFFYSGDVAWGCGFRPEMIPDKNNPGFWENTNFCPKHIHLRGAQLTHEPNTENDYAPIDCNVSR